ncbi:MAG: hypothetical protein ACREQ5_03225 [Candidatus Dormibacteria bacterium]
MNVNLSIGVIAPILELGDPEAITARFAAGGFTQPPVIFTETISTIKGQIVRPICEPEERGTFQAWAAVARWLLDRRSSELLMLADASLEFSSAAYAALLDSPVNHLGAGYVSLFSSELMQQRQPKAFANAAGWCEVEANRSCVGSACVCFQRKSLLAFLETPVNAEWTVPQLAEANPERAHGIDAILAETCGTLGMRAFYHAPSLCRMLDQPAVLDWRRE